MAFYPISPDAVGLGLTEYSEEVAFRIAPRRAGSSRFHLFQYVLKAHDGDGLDVASLAQTGAEQGVRQLRLVGRHLPQGQPLSRLGDEVPVEALVVIELVSGLVALFGCQRAQ